MSRLYVLRCMHPVHSISEIFEVLQWNHDCATKNPPFWRKLYQKTPQPKCTRTPPPPKCTRCSGMFLGVVQGVFWYIPGGFLVHFGESFLYKVGFLWVHFGGVSGTFWGFFWYIRVRSATKHLWDHCGKGQNNCTPPPFCISYKKKSYIRRRGRINLVPN